MKQTIKTALAVLFLMQFSFISHATNDDGIGCGDLHIGLSSTPNLGLSTIPYGTTDIKGEQSKNGVVYEGPFCTDNSTFITVSFNGIVEGQRGLKGESSKGPSSSLSSEAVVKVIAIPSDEFDEDVTNLFDCSRTSETNGISRFQRPRIISMPNIDAINLSKEDVSKDGSSDNIILLGEIPVSELRRQEIFYGGTLYGGLEAISMFNSFTEPDGWVPVDQNSGMFIGLIDLSPLSDDQTYRLVAYVCDENAETVECPYLNVPATAKEDNSKNNDSNENPADFNGALFAAIPFATAIGDDCPELAIGPDFSDPCSCTDPLNGYVDGALVLYHDVLEVTDGAGETWTLGVPNTEFYLDAAGTMVAGFETPLEYDAVEGKYILHVWHQPGIGWDAPIIRTSDGSRFDESNSCEVDMCPLIPTMGQWSLFILALLLSSIAVVFVGFKSRRIA